MPTAPDLRAGPAVARGRRPWPSRRLALGLSPTPRPVLVLLLLGMGLGPHGMGLISGSVLTLLDPVVSMALATLGVLAGLEITVGRPRELRLLGAATIESGITLLSVTAGALLLSRAFPQTTPWLLALMLGVCAASSSTPVTGSSSGTRGALERLGDLDDVLPIVMAIAAFVWTRPGSPLALAWFLVQATAVAAAIAGVAWLLLTQTSSESEGGVFVIGTLLLLGGAAAHLSVSALFLGLIAALVWNAVGGAARDQVARDAQYLQHPLMVLLLIVAGARLAFTTDVVGAVAAYVVFRIAGKLFGGWVASRFDPTLPRALGLSLTAPGVVGIAIAVNVFQARSPVAATLLLIVTTGSLALELLSLVAATPNEDR